MTPAELAAYLKVSQKTLANWRCLERGPTYYRVGRDIRYAESDVTTWLNTHAWRDLHTDPAHHAASA